MQVAVVLVGIAHLLSVRTQAAAHQQKHP